MNTTSKEYLQALGIIDRLEYIIGTRKINSKHNHLKNVQNNTNALLNKVKSSIYKFAKWFKNGFPSFWDGQEYLIS